MIKISSSLFFIFIFASAHAFAQSKTASPADDNFAQSLMSYTQHAELLLPIKYLHRELPIVVDNSLSDRKSVV